MALAFVIWFVAFVLPLILVLRKAGYSGWWILLFFIPLANIIGLWIFATARWPNLRDRDQT
ncbi:MAG: hypothetical protein KF874_11755 [Rhizobiaceae bacterium]|nr:hypothetical protein [Rhizobiaceae bacterium]